VFSWSSSHRDQCNACTTHRGAPQRTCAELLLERALAREDASRSNPQSQPRDRGGEDRRGGVRNALSFYFMHLRPLTEPGRVSGLLVRWAGAFHGARLALVGATGMMPQLRNGAETASVRYGSVGLTLTLGFGGDR
jgi:hypothetical protein